MTLITFLYSFRVLILMVQRMDLVTTNIGPYALIEGNVDGIQRRFAVNAFYLDKDPMCTVRKDLERMLREYPDYILDEVSDEKSTHLYKLAVKDLTAAIEGHSEKDNLYFAAWRQLVLQQGKEFLKCDDVGAAMYNGFDLRVARKSSEPNHLLEIITYKVYGVFPKKGNFFPVQTINLDIMERTFAENEAQFKTEMTRKNYLNLLINETSK
jgi:hypothetical protein